MHMETNGKEVNAFSLGAAFMQHCLMQRWIVHKVDGKMHVYLITPEGEKALTSDPYNFKPDSFMKRLPKVD